ncbi:MAG: hypothetical protein ABR543_04175 [Gemmatimonadaceae bacterium]
MLEALRQSASASVSIRATASLASFLAVCGERDRAEALLAAIARDGYMDHHAAYSMGATYAQLGDLPLVRQWLTRAADTGFPCHQWFARDPLLDPARKDPEFQRLLDRLRIQEQSVRARFLPQRTKG